MPLYPWKIGDSESLPSLLRFANANELLQLEKDLALLSPGMFAAMTSQGKWKLARHLELLDQTILESIQLAQHNQLEGLIVSMPPQHGKSELCSKYLPAWYLGTFPDHRVLLTSYEADFASTWGRKARDLMELYGHLFGVRVSPRSSAKNRWDLVGRDGGMSTAGVGGPITGRGAHLLIIDDPIKNDEEARSPTIRQKQWDWWQSTASTRLRPGGLIVVIQTRWHRDDLTGRLLEHAKTNGQRWRSVVLPALAQENDPLSREPGEALWPEVYSGERLERIRTSRTAYYWQSLYQQNPQAEGGAEWADSLFGPNIWFGDWPSNWHSKTIAIDPSKGTDAKFGDYSAFVLLMFAHDGKLYIDADLAIRNTTIIAETALEYNRTFKPDAMVVEVNQFQELLVGDIRRLAQERNQLVPTYTLDNRVNKLVRIRRLTSYLTADMLRFKGDSPGAKLLVQQLKDFPNGDHDDGPDALEMAIRMAGDLLEPNEYERVVGQVC